MAKIQDFRFIIPVCRFRKGKAQYLGDVQVAGMATVFTLQASGISTPIVSIRKMEVLPAVKRPRILHGHEAKQSLRRAYEAEACKAVKQHLTGNRFSLPASA